MLPSTTKDIFISYKNDYIGSLFASRLRDNLINAGYTVYYNPHEKNSSDFRQKLINAVNECTDLILIVSPGCLNQLISNNAVDWIREEILIAHATNKHIIPLLIGGTIYPQDWTVLPEELRFLPAIDYIVFPQAPEEFYEAPFSRLTSQFIKSKPNSSSIYRDIVSNNSIYDIRADTKQLTDQANNGSIPAMFELGIMYFYGLIPNADNVIEENYAEAYFWMKKVALSEHELSNHAKNILAHMYYCGRVPLEEQSYEMAYQLHREASETDLDSAAQRAFQERIGCGCDFDYARTVAYYESIIEKGDNVARLELAKLYASFGYYQKALEQYNAMPELSPEAAYNLGMLYKTGVLTDPPMPDHLHAAYYLSLAADVHPLAANELGLIYFRPCGKTIRKNFLRAEHYFTIAAEKGNVSAQYMLGFMFEHGHVSYNIEKSIEWFKLAADQGDSLSAVELAKIYQLDCPSRDYAKAYKYAEIAAGHGVSEAFFILGCLLFLGRGCKANVSKAKQNFEYAYSHGVYPAKTMLDKIERLELREDLI